jgi:GNAT superfamily N-acetyltransferase
MVLAHKQPIKSAEWFHWKFEQSPYGKAIMACAFDGDRVAGCVAYGRGVVQYKGKDWKCALSYETFVHPDYQGQGLFKKLILLAEQEMKKEGIQFLYNFPNTNSITGFKHMNWICRNDIRVFKIKLCHPLRVLCNLKKMRQSFTPAPSNLSVLKDLPVPELPLPAITTDIINPLWTKEYLQWRFFTHPNREYLVCDNEKFFSVSMVGSRGGLKSVHILYASAKDNRETEFIMGEVVKHIKQQARPDLIEYASTVMDKSLNKVLGFIKVPAHGNFCYKILDDEMQVDEFKIVLPSINAHTY